MGKNKFCPSLQAEAKSDSKWFRNGCQVGNEPLPKWQPYFNCLELEQLCPYFENKT